MAQNPRNKINPHRFPRKITPDYVKECRISVREPLPLYQRKDGEPTTDITLAELDPFGRPIQVGYSKTEFTIPSSQKPLCLDPADPSQRLRAIEARARMENMTLEPTIYEDSIQAVQRSNNIVNKVLSHVTTTPPPTPVQPKSE